jgi:DNA-binding XRE family transcriptional regulator
MVFGNEHKEHNEKQSWLIIKPGASPTTLNTSVNVDVLPHWRTPFKIAKALAVKVKYLWGEDDEE